MNTQNEHLHFDNAQYDMLLLCVLLSQKNPAIVNKIPDFESAILEGIKPKTDSIGLLMALQKENSKGTAQMKNFLKSNLAAKMFAVSEPFAGYAAKQNQMEWYVAFNKASSTYMAMRPALIMSQADYIINTVGPELANLTGTTVRQTSLDAIKDARDLFELYATAPRGKVVSKHDKLKLMCTFLEGAMNIMRMQCDKFEAGFVTLGEDSFHNEWLRSRKLTPYGTLTTRASIDVFLGDSNAPVANATAIIVGTPLSGTTDDKGHTTISRAPFDSPQFITVTAPGFENPVTAGPFTFKKGKALHITINMNQFNIPAPVNSNSNVNA